ncbi:Vps62-related protein [Streptomyces sp. NPDC048290]|uniref:Vps62-related protein n=1 Tax=Streptomyces sp. NPDC048290 TaxID=3155811 RepID=UPI00342BB43C
MSSPQAGSPASQTYWYDYGELRIAFTDQFSLDYQDDGSGASMYGRFWHPVLPQWAQDEGGWCWLGGMSWPVSDYSGDPNGYRVGLIAKDHGNTGVLKPPTSWNRMWYDEHTGASMYGSAYRPVAPDGYVALGDIFTGNYDDWFAPDSSKPPWNSFACVRADYTHQGSYGPKLWDTDGAGSRPADESFWSVTANLDGQTFSQAADHALFSITGFISTGGTSDSPPSSPAPTVLMVPVPQIKVSDPPPPPSLTSFDVPPDNTTPVNDYSVVVPFGAIKDTELTVDQHVAGNAFYTLKHYTDYTLVKFINNQTGADPSTPQEVSVTVGVSDSQSQTYSASYGVTVGYQVGVDVSIEASSDGSAGFSAGGQFSMSSTVSKQLGYSTTTEVDVMVSGTITDTLSAPAQSNAALWAVKSTIAPCRPDGTCIDPNGGLGFTDHTALVRSTYPNT